MSEESAKVVPGLVIGQRRDGKRYYSESAKQEMVEQCLRPGASVSAIALANGMNANVLRKWIVKQEVLQATGSRATVMLPVKVERPVPARAGEPMPCELGTILIDLHARQVKFEGAVDEGALRAVLDALVGR